MVVNTNISALTGLNNLRKTENGLSTSLERLSSGLRINKAADDPSGLAISKGMQAQLGGISMAIQNAEDGSSLIETADASLEETQSILLRMRDLAVRGSNDATLTSDDLTRLDNEFQSLMSEITRKSLAVTFNSKYLFSGGFATGLGLQIGPDNGTNFQLTITISQVDATTLSIDTLDLTVAANAQTAISGINTALNQVSDTRALLGIQERRLGNIINDLSAESINISSAKSRITDADMASEISEYPRLQILQQTGTSILAQANAQPQTILTLLK